MRTMTSDTRNRGLGMRMIGNICSCKRHSALRKETSTCGNGKSISQIIRLNRRYKTRRPKNSEQILKRLRGITIFRNVENDGDLSGQENMEETYVKYDGLDPEENYVERIEGEILKCSSYSMLNLDSISGLDGVKEIIKEYLILPVKRPALFRGLRNPVNGVLLFGPPGTGKTLLAKCIASEMGSTFFNVSCTTLTSKWMGESEKLVRTLFDVAKYRQPSVIFIDEIDAILSQRSPLDSGSTRRMKNEFLVQMDGVCTREDDKILIMGTTNRPQELDDAARRRFVLRLYIPLPDAKDRKELLKKLLDSEPHHLVESDFSEIAKRTSGFSGADLKILCREAAMGPIRSIPQEKIDSITPSKVRPINKNDFNNALLCTKSTVSKNDIKSLSEWNKLYGRVYRPKRE